MDPLVKAESICLPLDNGLHKRYNTMLSKRRGSQKKILEKYPVKLLLTSSRGEFQS